MQRDSSSSKAYLLLDYVQRLERHREDRRAVHIHLSQLKAQNRREHHLRIAENTFDDLTKQFDGQVFAMPLGLELFPARLEARPAGRGDRQGALVVRGSRTHRVWTSSA